MYVCMYMYTYFEFLQQLRIGKHKHTKASRQADLA